MNPKILADHQRTCPKRPKQADQIHNSGGGYRITATQQIDLHIGIGLNDRAPAYIVGIGYSFRHGGLF